MENIPNSGPQGLQGSSFNGVSKNACLKNKIKEKEESLSMEGQGQKFTGCTPLQKPPTHNAASFS